MSTSIFNYQTLKVRLEKSSRSLIIKFNNDNYENSMTLETLFELESLLAWVTNRVEVSSIFIESSTDIFSNGFNQNILKKLSIDKLANFTKKLQKINHALMLLPQTVIIDLQMGASNIACELASACDIRIANRSCSIEFNHSQLGITPCSGGIAQLSELVGHGVAKNWLLTGRKIHFRALENSSYVFDSYTMDTRAEVIARLLNDIHKQSPVQRIQTKLAVIETVREKIELQFNNESKIAKAARVTEDWRSVEQDERMPAKNMKTAVKLSLVKKNESEKLPN